MAVLGSLKPEHELMISAVSVAAVLTVFQLEAPPMADVRASAPGGVSSAVTHTSIKGAAITSLAIVGGLALLGKSPTVYVVGGLTIAVVAWKYMKANVTHPVTGQVVAPGANPSAGGGGTIQGM
jgi:predicted cation transporter